MEEVGQERHPLRLSEQEFLETFKKVPRLAINLLIIDDQGKVLLTKRNIPPQKGYWHYPGGFLLRDESIVECQRRIAEKEFGLRLDDNNSLKLLGAFEDLDKDPRGHVVDLMYGLQLNDVSVVNTTDETSEFRFFEKLPREMGFDHQDTLIKLGYQVEE